MEVNPSERIVISKEELDQFIEDYTEGRAYTIPYDRHYSAMEEPLANKPSNVIDGWLKVRRGRLE